MRENPNSIDMLEILLANMMLLVGRPFFIFPRWCFLTHFCARCSQANGQRLIAAFDSNWVHEVLRDVMCITMFTVNTLFHRPAFCCFSCVQT